MILEKLEQSFNIRFKSMKEAILHRKKYLLTQKTKVMINWNEIGTRFGLNEKQALQRFNGLEMKYLDKWSCDEINTLKDRITQLWPKILNKRMLLKVLDNELGLSA